VTPEIHSVRETESRKDTLGRLSYLDSAGERCAALLDMGPETEALQGTDRWGDGPRSWL